jgi:benzoate-CoA ligase family protein
VDNAASAFVDEPVEHGSGHRVALVTAAGSATYRELQALTDRAGHALRRRGVEPEQRVALLLRDGPAFAATFFGTIKVGAVAVPLNTRLAAAEVRAILGDCRAKLLVADPDLLASGTLPLGGPRTVAVLSFDALVERAPASALVPEPVGRDAMAFWLYTSGTTGMPKAAVHPHRTLLAGCHYGTEVLRTGDADRVFATSKLFFAYALGNALLIPLRARASTYLCPAWPDPAEVARVMSAYRPTLFFSVPTFYARLLRAELAADTFESVRLCVSAGEPLPAAVYHDWRRRHGVELLDGIGATETVFMVLSNRPGQSRADCSGVPVPGTEARILDDEGRPVPEGEPGVLWVKTPSGAMGYWERLDQSRRAFVGEWFRTGDVYTRDAEGFYHHHGREDDAFKVAGQWVAPARVESVLLRHPAVAEAGVVGAPEPGGLVKPFAFVVAREPGAAEPGFRAELLTLLSAALAPHEQPRDLVIVSELPRTATGKLQRFKLRALVAGGTTGER